jgi:hypothetical protein
MSYEILVAEHLRITILRLLLEDAGYSCNESLLLDAVEPFGFEPSRDKLRVQLAWLYEQGLITLGGPEHCQVATLTARGEDAARGRATVPGIKRPRPGERI